MSFLDDTFTRWTGARGGAVLETVDTHTAGNPTRIVVGGLELPPGADSVPAARAWLRDHADHVRTQLVHEPRGGALTCAVVPVPAVDDTHDIGAVILEPGSYPPMCGHCMIGFAMVVAEFGLVPGRREGDLLEFTIRTPAGLVGARVRQRAGAAPAVILTNVDSYVVESGEMTVRGRVVPYDLVFGGDYYPTVQASRLGLTLDRAGSGELLAAAAEIRAWMAARETVDPVTGEPADVYQVMFHEPLTLEGGHTERVVVVAPPGAIDRSPCGTGSSALRALLRHRGELTSDAVLNTRSIIDSRFTVTEAGSRVVAGRTLIAPVLTGTAHVTGFSRTVSDPLDDLGDGFPPL